ncbi:uncharacterized mitochondrial protein AtMg00810-like [Aristolochia californica]|uniref:uncharacterized mitochondrial protein AtMg00810-like n=1 Tax=Aristolochia californica TaxID=171875 RepID=UPI0035D8A9AF
MDLPLGYLRQGESSSSYNKLVCKLHKSLYGLKQASCQWYSKFSHVLITFGFLQSKSDYSLFKKGHGFSFVALLVYVDDITLAGPSSHAITELKHFLHTQFKLKDLGCLKHFLGLDIAQSKQGIVLSQLHYTLQLLEDTSYLACKPTSIPMDPKLCLNATDSDLLPDITHYRRLVGKLLYLTLSRPDITFSVHKLTQFVGQPRLPYLKAVHHLLRYLKNSSGQGLLFSSTSSLQMRAYSNVCAPVLLKAFSDADWGSCLDSRRSTTGFCIFIGDFLVSWKAKKHTTVSCSSVEAKYRVLSSTASELIWLQQLLQDFQVKVDSPALLYCDNQAAIHIASNPTFHERTKHIEIDCHFVRERVTSGVLKLLPIRSQYELANMFTKPLPSTHLFSLLSKMAVKDIYKPH